VSCDDNSIIVALKPAFGSLASGCNSTQSYRQAVSALLLAECMCQAPQRNPPILPATCNVAWLELCVRACRRCASSC
jgi:hypothetical protein